MTATSSLPSLPDVRLNSTLSVSVALWVSPDGSQRVVYLSPAQSFSNAVAGVRKVLPAVTLEDARRMVRQVMPSEREFSDLDRHGRLVHTALSGGDTAVKTSPWRVLAHPVSVAGLIFALVLSVMAVSLSTLVEHQRDSVLPPLVTMSPMTWAPFVKWAEVEGMSCAKGRNVLRSTCVDRTGTEMQLNVTLADDQTNYWFTYGDSRTMLRIYADKNGGERFVRAKASQDLMMQFPSAVEGRYFITSTEADRAAMWGLSARRAMGTSKH